MAGARRVAARNDPEPPDSEPWRDVGEEAALAHVLAGGSLCVDSMAGTGKTFFLRKCIARLREAGKRVVCCATTHVAAANLDAQAMTLARFEHSFGRGVKMQVQVLVIDEFSCVPTPS